MYVFVDRVKRGVLILIDEIRRYRNDRYYFHREYKLCIKNNMFIQIYKYYPECRGHGEHKILCRRLCSLRAQILPLNQFSYRA